MISSSSRLPWGPNRSCATSGRIPPRTRSLLLVPRTQDPATKQLKPVAFLEGRINGQYIIEGLSAGFMYTLGGFGLILLDWAQDKTSSHRNRSSTSKQRIPTHRSSCPVGPRVRNFFAVAGIVFCFLSYNLVVLFIRIKVPNYLL